MGKRPEDHEPVMLTVLWPDSQTTTGKSYRELEENIRANQWITYESREDFRKAITNRCELWTGVVPPYAKSSKDFIQGLAASGFFLLAEEPMF